MTEPFQPDMFPAKSLPWFDGKTFEAKVDLKRLGRQQFAVYRTMEDGRWRTLREIAFATQCPEASISARLRDLRKPRWGKHTVERRRRGGAKKGLFEYRLIKAPQAPQDEGKEPWWVR